jgi:hypothetical protein
MHCRECAEEVRRSAQQPALPPQPAAARRTLDPRTRARALPPPGIAGTTVGSSPCVQVWVDLAIQLAGCACEDLIAWRCSGCMS